MISAKYKGRLLACEEGGSFSWTFSSSTVPNRGVFTATEKAVDFFRKHQNVPGRLVFTTENGTVTIDDLFFQDADLEVEDYGDKPTSIYSFELVDKRILWNFGLIQKVFNQVMANGKKYNLNTVKGIAEGENPYSVADIFVWFVDNVFWFEKGKYKNDMTLAFSDGLLNGKYKYGGEQIIDDIFFYSTRPNLALNELLDRASLKISLMRDGTPFLYSAHNREFSHKIPKDKKLPGGDQYENMCLSRPWYLDIYFPVDTDVYIGTAKGDIPIWEPVIMHDGKDSWGVAGGSTTNNSKPVTSAAGEWVSITTIINDWGANLSDMYYHMGQMSAGSRYGRWDAGSDPDPTKRPIGHVGDGPVTTLISRAGITANSDVVIMRQRLLQDFFCVWRIKEAYQKDYTPIRGITCLVDVSTGRRCPMQAWGDVWYSTDEHGTRNYTNSRRFMNFDDTAIDFGPYIVNNEAGIIRFERGVGQLNTVGDGVTMRQDTKGYKAELPSLTVQCAYPKREDGGESYYHLRFDIRTGKWTTTVVDERGKVDSDLEAWPLTGDAVYSICCTDLTALWHDGGEENPKSTGWANEEALERRAVAERRRFSAQVADVTGGNYTFVGFIKWEVGPGVQSITWQYPEGLTHLNLNPTRDFNGFEGAVLSMQDRLDAQKKQADAMKRKMKV